MQRPQANGFIQLKASATFLGPWVSHELAAGELLSAVALPTEVSAGCLHSSLQVALQFGALFLCHMPCTVILGPAPFLSFPSLLVSKPLPCFSTVFRGLNLVVCHFSHVNTVAMSHTGIWTLTCDNGLLPRVATDAGGRSC